MIRSLAGVSLGWLGISLVADGVPSLLLPYQVAALGGDATTLGLWTLLAIGLAALAQPFAGAWSDRAGRVPVVMIGFAMTVLGLAWLLLPGGLFPGIVATLMGVSVAQAAYQGLLPDRIPRPMRGRAAGGKGVFDVGGAFLAFAILGGLLAAGGVGLAALILAVGLGGSLLFAFVLLGMRRTAVRPPARSDEGDLPVGLPGGLAHLIAARFLFLLGIYAVGRFLLLFTADRLDLSPSAAAGEAGAVLAALALITALTALPAGWLTDRTGRSRTMLAGGLLGGVGIAALPMADSLMGILAFGSLMAVGSAAFGTGSWAALADISARADSGRLLGIANLGTAGAAAAAGLFGPIIDAVDRLMPGAGYTAALMLAGTITALGGLLGSRANILVGSTIDPVLEGST